jgi:hypothetical protein
MCQLHLRGHWERNTLVVDVTNFTIKTDFRESCENLHLIECWPRVEAQTLERPTSLPRRLSLD